MRYYSDFLLEAACGYSVVVVHEMPWHSTGGRHV